MGEVTELDACQAIAGAVMHNAAYVVAAIRSAQLDPRELNAPERLITFAGVELHDEGERVTPEAIEARLVSEGTVDMLRCRGGAAYVYWLYLAVVTPYSVAFHIRRRRRINIMRLAATLDRYRRGR